IEPKFNIQAHLSALVEGKVSPHRIDVGVFSLKPLYLLLQAFQTRQLYLLDAITSITPAIPARDLGCFGLRLIGAHIRDPPSFAAMLPFGPVRINRLLTASPQR